MNTTNKKKFRVDIGEIIRWTFATIILIIAVFPIWWMFNIVFSEPGVAISINPRFWPTSLTAGVENILAVLSEGQFLKSYLVSTAYTVLVILGTLMLCSMAAYEFALFDFPGKKYLFGIILLALMIPTAVTLIPTYLLVANLGWLNSMQGLVVPGMASAFGLFMLTQFLGDIPKDVMDAARIDGASHFGIYRYIVLPLSSNALITLAILTFMTTWGNFIWPMVISTQSDLFTVSQMINWYNDPMSYTTMNVVMAANLLAAVPPLLFYVLFQKQIINGVAMSGIKG
ncbi:MAG: carbohydrate ABC transporter permease [Anaerolineaceae bacterium]|nr:carbohydrate ABC transporter permease [Anaerolineaceae bacterium]